MIALGIMYLSWHRPAMLTVVIIFQPVQVSSSTSRSNVCIMDCSRYQIHIKACTISLYCFHNLIESLLFPSFSRIYCSRFSFSSSAEKSQRQLLKVGAVREAKNSSPQLQPPPPGLVVWITSSDFTFYHFHWNVYRASPIWWNARAQRTRGKSCIS